MDKLILTKIAKICIIFILAIFGYIVFRYTLSILLPVVAVILMALIMEPGVQFLQQKAKFPRPLASILVLLSFVAIFAGFITLIVSELYDGIAYLAEYLPGQLSHLGAIVDEFFNTKILPFFQQLILVIQRLTDGQDILFFQDRINELFEGIAELVSLLLQKLLLAIPGQLAIIPESITVIFFILFSGFLLSADFPRVKDYITNLIPTGVSRKLNEIIYHIKKSTFFYIRAQLILVMISFLLIFIGLTIIRVEHAMTISLFMIIIDLIPFLGTGLLFIPWIGYSFLTGDYSFTIGLSVVYGIVIITRQLIEPKIFSMNLAIHPLAWLLVAFVGWKIWGVAGLLVAPFIIVFLKGLQDAGVFRWVVEFINGKI